MYKCVERDTGLELAVKVASRLQDDRGKVIANELKPFEKLAACPHVNVVQVVGKAVDTAGRLQLVMRYYTGGSLKSALDEVPATSYLQL